MAELALRLVAFAAILLAFYRLGSSPAEPGTELAPVGESSGVLARWSGDPGVMVGHLSFDRLPSDADRDWMRAFRAVGVAVTYDAPPLPPIAVASEAVADPTRPVRILVAAPPGVAVAVADALGPLDSLTAAGAGAELEVTAPASPITAALPAVVAGVTASDSLILRPILVLGRAGWESKFTVAVLEERGWTVISRLSVAPDVDVVHGVPAPLDTARLAAVVAVDGSAATFASAIARYVRSGGGLVLGAEAAGIAELARLAPGRPGAPATLHSEKLSSPDPRAGLPFTPLVGLVDDAIALERRDGGVAVAARRVGSGRVVQLGYAESWRWRMAGPDGSVEAHRSWWAALVAGVAYAPAAGPVAGGTDADTVQSRPLPAGDSAATASGAWAPSLDDAPVARLIDAVGPSTAVPAGAAADRGSRSPMSWWMFTVAAVALLAEWGSRRLRGVR